MSENLQRAFERLIVPQTKDDISFKFHMFKEVLFKIIVNHENTDATPIAQREARLVLQMMFSKVANIEKLTEGIEFTSASGKHLRNITDPITIIAAIRGIFESVGMFNVVYVASDSDEGKAILHKLWVIAGLNYRQKFVSVTQSAEFIQKSKDEKQTIDNLTDEIKATALFQSLSQADKDKVLNAIKGKHYNVVFTGNQVKGLNGFQETIDNTGIDTAKFGQMYTYYSLASHPSNVSVFQFGAMFSDDDSATDDIIKFNLGNMFMLASVFIIDYVHTFPEVKATYDTLSQLERAVIEQLNRFLRG